VKKSNFSKMKNLDDISFEASKQIQQSQNIQNLLKTKNSQSYWRIFSKAKNALEDGHRLENISWRLFHMNVRVDIFLMIGKSCFWA
jgi:Fungal protein of unknown function (DUF1752)